MMTEDRPKDPLKVKAGRIRANAFTPDYQSMAGRRAYQAKLQHFLQLHWPDFSRAAQAMTGFRRACGFRNDRGLTEEYMIRKARELGMLPANGSAGEEMPF